MGLRRTARLALPSHAKALGAALMRTGNAAEAEKVYRAGSRKESKEPAVAIRTLEITRASAEDRGGSESEGRVRRVVGGGGYDARRERTLGAALETMTKR